MLGLQVDEHQSDVTGDPSEIAARILPRNKELTGQAGQDDEELQCVHGKHPVNPSCQLGGAGRPAMREQFGDVGRLVGRQSREDVFQIGVGIVPVELGRLDQAHDGSRALTGAQ